MKQHNHIGYPFLCLLIYLEGFALFSAPWHDKCVGLITLRPSCADDLEILEASISWRPKRLQVCNVMALWLLHDKTLPLSRDHEHPATRAKFVAFILMKNWNKNTFSYIYKGYSDELIQMSNFSSSYLTNLPRDSSAGYDGTVSHPVLTNYPGVFKAGYERPIFHSAIWLTGQATLKLNILGWYPLHLSHWSHKRHLSWKY